MDTGREGVKSGVPGGESSCAGGNGGVMSRPWAVVVMCAGLVGVLAWSAGALALSERETRESGPPTPLGKSFTDFPTDFLAGYNWRQGTLDPEIEKLVGSNATLKLTGYNQQGWAEVYTSYFGYASTPLEHEPDVCYPAQGWSLPLGVIRREIDVPGWDQKLPISIYFFTKDVDRVLVINYYCINGQYFNDRTPTKFMNTGVGGYYAQTRVTVDIRSEDMTATDYESHVDYRRAVEIMRAVAPLVERHLPTLSTVEVTDSVAGQ